jgi:hypothetical protein
MASKRRAASLLTGILLAGCAGTPGGSPQASIPPAASPTRAAPPILAPTPLQGASPTPSLEPRGEPPELAAATARIAAGWWHTCVITDAGGVECWGSSESESEDGALGNTSAPLSVPGLERGVVSITAGAGYTCVLTSAGGVKCWGSNAEGQLGDGTTDDSTAPVDVVGLTSGVAAIAGGSSHVCALTDLGSVKCWGYDYDDAGGDWAINSPVPIDIPGLEAEVAAIAAAGSGTCARWTWGTITCFGDGPFADLNRTLERGEVIAAGSFHSCVVTSTGRVACWGSNESGQLGNGTTRDSNAPVEVTGIAGGVIAVTVGGEHSCALMEDDRVLCWGSNELGQIGSPTLDESHVPVEVTHAPRFATDASGAIEHPNGPADVLLRYDHGPDLGGILGVPGDESFRSPWPGPEFTLYGDGTIIFRDETRAATPAKGPVARGTPFARAHLAEDQVQALLAFALTDGGMAVAAPKYDSGGEGCDDGVWTYTLHAGGIDRRVESGGCVDILEQLGAHLRSVAADARAQAWAPDAYWASLVRTRTLVRSGLLSRVPATDVRWPWPRIRPADFARLKDSWPEGEALRLLTVAEAARLGVTGGGVQRTYLLGPDGTTAYALLTWPMLPDETGWVSPADGGRLTSYRVTLAARPEAPSSGAGPDTSVAFNVAGADGRTMAACTATAPDALGAWSCRANLLALGVPPGEVELSFDVRRTGKPVDRSPVGSRTVTYAPAPPKPTNVSMVQVTPPAFENGDNLGTYEVTWSAPTGYADEFLVYYTEECPRPSNRRTAGKPCFVPGTPVDVSQLVLLGAAPGDARTIRVQVPESDCEGVYGSVLLRARNAWDRSSFAIVQAGRVRWTDPDSTEARC